MVPAAAFRLTSGKPREYIKTADSGAGRVQAFCETCGSGIYSCETGGKPAAYNLRVGTVDQRADLTPRFDCWCQSALSWVRLDKTTRKFATNPA